jgi:perosamine synthetase
MKIPYAKPSITQLEIDYVNDAVTNGWGDKRNLYIDRFETEFAEHLGVKYAIATSSCTGALHMGLSALDIGPGDEVILADSNWIATVAPVVHLGATPIFVDVLGDSWCIDPALVENAITKNTRAIIATHLYGNLANMNALLDVGHRHGLPVIEDAAEAIGSKYFGRRAGSLGCFGVFSFHGSKTITTGEGGMFVTSDVNLFERVLTLSNHGRDRYEARMFWPSAVGFKYKMSNVQAALGCAQLSRIDSIIAKRQWVLAKYKSALMPLGGVYMNPDQVGSENGGWMPTVVLEKGQRSPLIIQSELRRQGVDVRPFFAPLSETSLFSHRNDNPEAKFLWLSGLNLPSFHDFTPDEFAFIIDAFQKVFSEKIRRQNF